MNVCLGIDASAEETTAAVVVDGDLKAKISSAAFAAPESQKGSGELLLFLVQEVLTASGLKPAEIGSVAVGIGPGSFTGIRNGISTALGLSMLFDKNVSIPVYGVSSLLARAVSVDPSSIVPRGAFSLLTMPANRQENFGLLFQSSPGGSLEVLSGALILQRGRENEFLEGLIQQLGSDQPGVSLISSVETKVNLAALNAAVKEVSSRIRFEGSLAERLQSVSVSAASIGTIVERSLHFQTTGGGIGLVPLYAKPVQAKSLAERGLISA